MRLLRDGVARTTAVNKTTLDAVIDLGHAGGEHHGGGGGGGVTPVVTAPRSEKSPFLRWFGTLIFVAFVLLCVFA